jgi:hypothetical protein
LFLCVVGGGGGGAPPNASVIADVGYNRAKGYSLKYTIGYAGNTLF